MPKQFEYNRSSDEGQRIASLATRSLQLIHDVEGARERLIAMTRTAVEGQADAIDFEYFAGKVSSTEETAEKLFNEFDSFHGQLQNAAAAVKQLAAFAG